MVLLLPSRILLSQMLSSQLLLHSAEQAHSEAPWHKSIDLLLFPHLQGLSASEVSWQKCRAVELPMICELPMELPAAPETPRWMRMWMRRAEELPITCELPLQSLWIGSTSPSPRQMSFSSFLKHCCTVCGQKNLSLCSNGTLFVFVHLDLVLATSSACSPISS